MYGKTNLQIRNIIYIILMFATPIYGNRNSPNILLIMADDLGIGDVGCFGNDTIRTPNIDRLAKEGVKLTHHLAAASMCTPSRAAFLTGRYPIRSGMVAVDFIKVHLSVSNSGGLPANETTIGELAKEQGYSTGFYGKWHQGLNCEKYADFCHHPLNQGFDHFFGLPLTNLKDFGNDGLSTVRGKNPHLDTILIGMLLSGIIFALALSRLGICGTKGSAFLIFLAFLPMIVVYSYLWTFRQANGIVMRDFVVVEQPVKLEGFTDRIIKEGTTFLQNRQKDQRPFLLIMSWIQVHTALHATKPFQGRSAHGMYGDEVEEMDWSVGEILNALDNLGFSDNTFVYFTSDQGGHLEELGIHGNKEGGWNGIYKGGKGQGGMEGGIRVPTVARYPGIIPSGSVVNHPTSLMDILPTVASIIEARVPTDRIIDGVNIMPLLEGNAGAGPPHDFLVHYCGDQLHAARYVPGDGKDVYKIHFATPKWKPGTFECDFICDCHGNAVIQHNPPLMYNIAKDPSEKILLDVKKPKYAQILKEMLKRTEEHKRSLIPVESQFTLLKHMPRIHLQPCCNWPVCSCEETQSNILKRKIP